MPSASPTPVPTAEPSMSPSMMPSATPSLTPTVDPTIEPTYDPTTVPSLVPSADPTADPTSDPTTTDPIVPLTNSPQGLREVLMENEGAPQLQLFTNYILYGILSAVFLTGIVATAFTIRFSGLEDLINVDDQRPNGSLRFTVQIVDVFTDIAFALQCRAFWLYLRDGIHFNVDADPEVFGCLYRLSLICVVAPYAMNLISAINIARKIAGSDSLSEHSKQFFSGTKQSVLCDFGVALRWSFPLSPAHQLEHLRAPSVFSGTQPNSVRELPVAPLPLDSAL